MFDIVFWILAAITVGAALAVIVIRDIFRAALCLILFFLSIAGIYITLYADFLALVQILIYVGAVSILIIVGIMLTRDVWQGNPSGKLRIPAFAVGILLLGVLIFAMIHTGWQISDVPPQTPTTAAIGIKLFGEYILPMEIAAVLLLSAILGAIVLIREK